MILDQYSHLLAQNTFGGVVTVIEPHHDDFVLDLFGTMFVLDQLKVLKKLKIITVFGISPGCSKAPTSTVGHFFDNCEFESIEYLKPNLFNGGHADRRKREAAECESLESEWFNKTGIDWKEFEKELVAQYEGTVMLPMGLKHADHNLLSRLPGDLLYREYPYWWHREENHPRQPESLYWYYDIEKAFDIELIKEVNDYKWRVFRTVYADVQGQFNPRFGSARPYFASVNTEALYKKKGGEYAKTHDRAMLPSVV